MCAAGGAGLGVLRKSARRHPQGAAAPRGRAPAAPGAASSSVQYYRDAKPILDSKCVTCHVAGGIAPFALDTFESTKPVLGLIKDNVVSKKMPPGPRTTRAPTTSRSARSLPIERT